MSTDLDAMYPVLIFNSGTIAILPSTTLDNSNGQARTCLSSNDSIWMPNPQTEGPEELARGERFAF